jgi:hypothetical protein
MAFAAPRTRLKATTQQATSSEAAKDAFYRPSEAARPKEAFFWINEAENPKGPLALRAKQSSSEQGTIDTERKSSCKA